MFLKDPFAIGPAEALTPQQETKKKLDAEWDALGKPTLEERIETRNRVIAAALKRALQ